MYRDDKKVRVWIGRHGEGEDLNPCDCDAVTQFTSCTDDETHEGANMTVTIKCPNCEEPIILRCLGGKK